MKTHLSCGLKRLLAALGAVMICTLSGPIPSFGAGAGRGGGASPATQPATAPARGARAGRGGGRGGAPLSEADQAEIAKLNTFPPLTKGAGDGNYSIGPEYLAPPELTPRDNVAKGKVGTFAMVKDESKIYPNTNLRGRADTPTRLVTVYVPAQYVAGSELPFIVSCDAYGARNNQLPTLLDNMIADKRLPVMGAVMIQNGGGDGPGSQRGYEYDTVSSKYAAFVESEVLPRVEKEFNVKLTKDPEGRMTLGGSSGGSAAFGMAWWHPEWYHKVLIYSGTFVGQARDETYPKGAWEYHEKLVPNSPAKPIRIWMHVGQNDNRATLGSESAGNWVIANIRMAEALKAKGYHYQFIYAKESGYTPAPVIAHTYPQALEYVWKGYPIAGKP